MARLERGRAGGRFEGLVCAALALAIAPMSHAQQPPPSAGDALRELQEKPSVPPSTPPRIEVAPVKRAVKPIAGLKFNVKGFRFTGLTAVSEQKLQPLVASFIGPDKTFDELQAAADAVSEYLQREGYFVAQAYLPEQDISGGVVEIAILEGRLAQLSIDMDDSVPVSRHIIEGLLSSLTRGTVLHRDTVERALFLVADLRGLNIRSIVEPGTEPGTSNLVVKISGAARIDGLVELDNHSSRFTGDYRLGAGVNINSPFGRGDLLSFRGLMGLPGGSATLDFGRISYLTPIGNYGTKVGMAYLKVNYHLGTTLFEPLQQTGSSDVASVFALHPFIRTRNLNLFGQASLDLRRFNDTRHAVGTSSDRKTKLGTYSLVGDSRDALLGGGINNFSVSYTGGHLDLDTPADFTADQSTLGHHIAGRYDRVNGSLARLNSIGQNSALFTSYSFQWAAKNLDSSEKIGLGGPSAVRAYAVGEATSDEAHIATAELRFGLPQITFVPGNTVASVFYDYAHGKLNKDPLPLEAGNNTRTLRGFGIGLTWARQDDFLARVFLAWRLAGPPLSDPVERRPRVFFQLQKYL